MFQHNFYQMHSDMKWIPLLLSIMLQIVGRFFSNFLFTKKGIRMLTTAAQLITFVRWSEFNCIHMFSLLKNKTTIIRKTSSKIFYTRLSPCWYKSKNLVDIELMTKNFGIQRDEAKVQGKCFGMFFRFAGLSVFWEIMKKWKMLKKFMISQTKRAPFLLASATQSLLCCI